MQVDDALTQLQLHIEKLEAAVQEQEQRSDAKPWDGRLLDVVQKRVELTIDNGTTHQTVSFRAWSRRRAPRGIYETPEMYWVDCALPGVNRGVHIGTVRVYYNDDQTERDYRFEPKPLDSLPHWVHQYPVQEMQYAAHLCYLALTGTDLAADEYTDLKGVRRQPSDRYTIQPVERCMRCFRKLTAPSSIEAAFGPECQKMVFGSADNYHTRVLGGKR